MNINGEDLGELGGLGDVLPAEVLKKLNEVLERLHQADHHHGGNIINIYASGSQHVDRVEKQYIYALERPLPRPLPREGGGMREGYCRYARTWRTSVTTGTSARYPRCRSSTRTHGRWRG